MSKALFMEQNVRPGEMYAGLILGKNGEQDYHLFLLPNKAEGLSWDKAVAFAAEAGGELPTRREHALLSANLKEEFEPRWYWSGEQHASDPSYAWVQHFDDGFQYYCLKDYEGRVRVVRRLVI
ncbi:DUF1566 domain-containing protein [Duganella sp. CY15W]|uniref:DUF1566 domain-containing protein n=1 Tax=Duganella sp. CY15W TaxID=2692172 RepID=UPI00136F16F6|nr:DUF1566 domain-containing protein [Duganella sp. CY15W]MYM31517.1 DUF1566 domain-containing protein [Duganella sp. CY15W]